MKNSILNTLIFSILFFACNIAGDSEFTELERIPSPDNMVEAVLVSSDAGATTSIGYHLFVVPTGQNIESGYENLIADHVSEFKIFWCKNRLLEIHYKNARIFKFSNFWQTKNLENWSYVVELKLVPQEQDFSLTEQDRWLVE